MVGNTLTISACVGALIRPTSPKPFPGQCGPQQSSRNFTGARTRRMMEVRYPPTGSRCSLTNPHWNTPPLFSGTNDALPENNFLMYAKTCNYVAFSKMQQIAYNHLCSVNHATYRKYCSNQTDTCVTRDYGTTLRASPDFSR